MKKLRKITAILAALVLSVIVFAGCNPTIMRGNGSDDYEVNLNIDRNITETLRILVPNNDGGLEKSYINALKPGFKELFPNVEIVFDERTISDQKYAESINSAIASNRAPDLFYTNTAFYYYLVAKNCVVNIEPYLNASQKAGVFNLSTDLYESFFNMGSYEDKRYVVPRSADTVVTVYNKEILTAAGIDPATDQRMNNDWTWENLISLCDDVRTYLASPAAVANNHNNAYALQPSFDWESIFNPFMLSYGAKIFDDNGNVAVDSQEMRDFAEMLRDISGRNKFVRSPLSPSTFENGNAAFAFLSQGPYRMDQYSPVHSAGFDFLPFPLIGDNPHIGSGFAGWSISAATQGSKRDLAWQFLNYMISAEGQMALINAGSSTPSIRVDIAEEKSWGRGYETLNLDAYLVHDEYKCSSDWFTHHDPSYTFDILSSIQEFLTNIATGSKSVDQYVAAFKTALDEAVE